MSETDIFLMIIFLILAYLSYDNYNLQDRLSKMQEQIDRINKELNTNKTDQESN